eukprot:7013492-Prymnesium_polylepis.1
MRPRICSQQQQQSNCAGLLLHDGQHERCLSIPRLLVHLCLRLDEHARGLRVAVLARAHER